MHTLLGRLTIVTMSEFGRRVAENGSLGTSPGQWPGFAAGQLVGPGGLVVTTDYRAVLGKILQKQMNNPAADEIFPGQDFMSRDISA